jgi:hypothetical protein
MNKEQITEWFNNLPSLVRYMSNPQLREMLKIHNELFPDNKESNVNCCNCRQRCYNKIKNYISDGETS